MTIQESIELLKKVIKKDETLKELLTFVSNELYDYDFLKKYICVNLKQRKDRKVFSPYIPVEDWNRVCFIITGQVPQVEIDTHEFYYLKKGELYVRLLENGKYDLVKLNSRNATRFIPDDLKLINNLEQFELVKDIAKRRVLRKLSRTKQRLENGVTLKSIRKDKDGHH